MSQDRQRPRRSAAIPALPRGTAARHPHGYELHSAIPRLRRGPLPAVVASEEDATTATRWGWLTRWQAWAIAVVLVSGSLGFVATALLLKLPAVPNCPAIFWPTASASMRLYCAQLAANKRTEADLLEAIALVENLPFDHPLREEIDRNLAQWIEQLLEIGEEKFQNGDLAAAVALANQVKGKMSDPRLVEERIQQWQAIWQEAEAIADEARREMHDSKWGQAFQTAAKLTKLDNRYWATTRYDALYEEINLAREESRKLDDAFAALDRGDLDSLLKAIQLAQAIPAESTAWREAQTLIREASDRLLQLATRELEAGNWQAVATIANRIPKSLNLQDTVTDLNTLANAGLSASFGTVSGLDEAIAEAQRLPPGRPLFNQAQNLIARWQLAREATIALTQAESIASYGDISSLTAAIAQARTISSSNPRYQEAQAKIADWQSQIRLIEDRPFLDRAVELAQGGSAAAWRQAVDQASAIESGSPLYDEAQERIREWNADIQAEADRDWLNRADAFANAGNLSQALAAVRQIGNDSPLFREAQSRIERWQSQASAEQSLQRAYQVASSGSADGLSQAIALAQQVPGSSTLSGQADQAIERWSEQLLVLAQRRSTANLREAIAIARRIPSHTVAYRTARVQIEMWERSLAGSI